MRRARGGSEGRCGSLLSVVVIALAPLIMAPTVGDVGGCGAEAQTLDLASFGEARKNEDCEHCSSCGIGSARCERACDPAMPPDVHVPETCRPLLHDGEVCIRALHAAPCDKWLGYVDDVAPTAPSECEFCRGAP